MSSRGLDMVSDDEWRRIQYLREFPAHVGGFERRRKYVHQGETKVTASARLQPGGLALPIVAMLAEVGRCLACRNVDATQSPTPRSDQLRQT